MSPHQRVLGGLHRFPFTSATPKAECPAPHSVTIEIQPGSGTAHTSTSKQKGGFFAARHSGFEYRNPVRIKGAIAGDDRVSVLDGLGHQQAIEGVAMVPRQGTNAQRGG